MSDSSTRFVSEVGSTRRQKSAKDVERPAGRTGLQDAGDHAAAHVAHGRQSVADRTAVPGRRGEVHVGFVDVGGQDLDAHPATRVQVVGLAILVVLDRREDRRHVLDRVVRHQIRGLVGDVAVGAGVRGVEPVVGEGLDVLEEALGRPLLAAERDGALHELLALGGDLLADLLAHDLAQRVGLAHREPGHHHRGLHDLLLVDDDAVGVLEHRLEVGVRVGDLLAAVLALRVLGVLPHRQQAGPVQGDARHQVLEPIRLEQLDQVLHARRLHLEHADRVAAAQHRVGLVVIQRHVVDVELDPAVVQVPQRLGDHREVPQARGSPS